MTERELEMILRRNPDIRVVEQATPRRPAIPVSFDKSQLVTEFLNIWKSLGGPELTPEARFHPVRRWRFDFAHEPTKIAVEINGGVWVNGRHVRGGGYLRDREKINAATALGWRVFELGTGQVTVDNVQAIVDLCH